MAEKKTKKTEEKVETEATEKAVKKESRESKALAEKEAEIEKLKEELKNQKDLLLRTAAEFDNFKRRKEKESLATAEFAKAQMLKKLLPVFDNVDRAMTVDKDTPEYQKGVELIVKMLGDSVENLGMVELAAAGDAFNPNIHEAVMHCEDENFGENTVCEVLQKGYKIGDTVIRPAMVKVAN